jgi:PAS domain S-box-containing protein
LAGTAITHAQLFADTQAAHERYAGLFNDSIDPIIITDLMGQVTEANHRAASFLGRTLDDLMERVIFTLHSPASDNLPDDLSRIHVGETISYDGQVTHRDGHRMPVEVHVKRIDIDRQPFLQWILRDISERMALDELRADLTSMIFHDLRSPLGNVMSSLEMLQASVPEDDETVQSVLSIAMRSSRRLSRLVESLLDLGQLEAGQAVLHKERASLGAVITEAVEEVHPVAEAKGHTLRFQLARNLPDIEFDVEMVRRVVINLLENAVKYTHSGGAITVSAASNDDKDMVSVSVSDTGPGISPRDQRAIFEKFARIHRDGRPKGLGLGLAFCRLAIEAHEGSIWVESEEGKGSTFTFTLPLV